jgi:hypothetical protein
MYIRSIVNVAAHSAIPHQILAIILLYKWNHADDIDNQSGK